MLSVGFLEEVIFRGLPFEVIAKDNIKSAIVISSVTFDIGMSLTCSNCHYGFLYPNSDKNTLKKTTGTHKCWLLIHRRIMR